MSYLLISLLMWLWNWRGFDQISQRNLALKEAEIAYQSANYKLAVQQYTFLLTTSKTVDPLVRLNLGHSLYQLKQYRKARHEYEQAIRLVAPEQATAAITQLGVIACIERDSANALLFFRQALLIDPGDEAARYNYELIQRLYTEPDSPPEKRKPEVKQKPQNQSKQANAGQDAVKSDQQKDVLHQLRSLHITEEQAMQLLNAMRDDDLPYELAQRRYRSSEQTKTTQRW